MAVSRIIGCYLDIFFKYPAAIATSIDADCDCSLTAGRDVFRVRNSGAASAGFDAEDVQGGCPCVFDQIIIGDLGIFKDTFKFMDHFRDKDLGAVT